MDVVGVFKKTGINAVPGFAKAPAEGDVLVVHLGGATAVYVIGKDPALIQKLVDVIQANEFAGPIFTRDALRGTFALDERGKSREAASVAGGVTRLARESLLEDSPLLGIESARPPPRAPTA